MAQHTPGAWYLCTIGDVLNIRSRQESITTHIVYMDSNTPEELANASLIAAAPDMLDALKELLRESDKGRYQDTKPIAWAQYAAQQAIAKAEGHT